MDFLYELGDLHLPVLAFTALAILYSDHKGLMYMLGRHEVLPERFVVLSHRLVWIGLIGMLVTGASLVAPSWEYRLTQGVFYIKMGLVLVLVMNAVAIGKLSEVATHTPFSQLSLEQKRTLLVSGTLSGTGWLGAAIIGFFFL